MHCLHGAHLAYGIDDVIGFVASFAVVVNLVRNIFAAAIRWLPLKLTGI